MLLMKQGRNGDPAMRSSALTLSLLLMCAAQSASQAANAQTREALTIPREHRGKPMQVTADLFLPPGTAKVPLMIIQHGSGGVSEAREFRYAREMVAMGVAALVIDSFKPRGITSTVQNQEAVSVQDIANDAFTALKQLATHPRIDATKAGITGFSKGGTVALEAALERRAARVLPPGVRFALHVPIYPGCSNHFHNPKLTGGPIYMLLGGADTYAGVAPCTEYAEKLKAAGAKIDVKIYPGAQHGFDTDQTYTDPKGENWSRCVFEEQPDFSWKERTSGQITFTAQGQPNAAGVAAALAKCRTYGVSGGPNPAAKAAAMTELKAAVQRHLIEGK
jgi:dienelactone hydrolase